MRSRDETCRRIDGERPGSGRGENQRYSPACPGFQTLVPGAVVVACVAAASGAGLRVTRRLSKRGIRGLLRMVSDISCRWFGPRSAMRLVAMGHFAVPVVAGWPRNFARRMT